MISFIRLIDGSMVIGKLHRIDEAGIQVIDVVDVECVSLLGQDNQYLFRGVRCPFNIAQPAISMFKHEHIIDLYDELDDHTMDHYTSYIKEWKDMKSGRKKAKKEPTSVETFFKSKKPSSNTELH